MGPFSSMTVCLGGQFKTDNSWTGKTDNFRAAETREFYFDVSSVRKSEWTLVRQLFGPHVLMAGDNASGAES